MSAVSTPSRPAERVADIRIAERGASLTAVHAAGLVGLLVVQVLVGYEWFISGLAKIVRGGFPSGLAGELTDMSKSDTSWYRDFLDNVIIPNASVFGYLIEVGEFAVGIALIGAALVWMFRWSTFSYGGRMGLLWVTALASLAGLFMNVNFHLAGAGTHPWLLPGDAFEEGVDLDSLLPAIQIVMIGVCIYAGRALRREHRAQHGVS